MKILVDQLPNRCHDCFFADMIEVPGGNHDGTTCFDHVCQILQGSHDVDAFIYDLHKRLDDCPLAELPTVTPKPVRKDMRWKLQIKGTFIHYICRDEERHKGNCKGYAPGRGTNDCRYAAFNEIEGVEICLWHGDDDHDERIVAAGKMLRPRNKTTDDA